MIGTDKYRHNNSLRNAVSDARAFGAKIKAEGGTVVYALDCKTSELNAKIDEYLGLLQENDVAMLYFAGHGCEYKNAFRMFAISEGDESNIDKDTVNLLVLINKSVSSSPTITCSFQYLSFVS